MRNRVSNILPLLLLAITLTIAISARAECPSDDGLFCSEYAKAAQGQVKAQYNVGLMYWNGEDVITDYREAFIWYSIAKANGSEEAAKSLREDHWGKYLTTAEIKSARREATQRLKSH